MRANSLLPSAALLALAACGPADPLPIGVTTGTVPGSGTASGTTTEPRGDDFDGFGSVMLVRSQTSPDAAPTMQLVGLFPTADPGYANLAQCALLDVPCLPQLPPDEDLYLDFDPERSFDVTQFDYSFAGTTVGIGPLRSFYQIEPVSSYYADLAPDQGLEGFDGTYGLHLAGDFGTYEGWDDVVVSPALRMMSHEPGELHEFHDGERLVFEWEPRGEGDVFLTISGELINRMYRLEDDGYFELRSDDLALGPDQQELIFSMARWNRSTVQVGRSEVDVISLSEVVWAGLWFYVGGREELPVVDTCGETPTVPAVGSGLYWGRLADQGFANDVDLGFGSCTGWFSRGQEGFIPFDLPPRTFLTISMAMVEDDASLYLLRDCDDVTSCLVGSDSSYIAGSETIQYFNGTDQAETVYAGFDGYTSTIGLFFADITINTMGPPDMYDTCSEVTNQAVPTPAGGYYTDITSYTNQLDPIVGGCTATSSPGPEALTKIEVGAGQTVTVNVDMAFADPSVYLLYNCSNTNSCAAGSDISVGPVEQVQYVNNSATAETLYLVVDSKTQLQPWFMTVDIQ